MSHLAKVLQHHANDIFHTRKFISQREISRVKTDGPAINRELDSFGYPRHAIDFGEIVGSRLSTSLAYIRGSVTRAVPLTILQKFSAREKSA